MSEVQDRLAEALQAEEQAKKEAFLWNRLFLEHAMGSGSAAGEHPIAAARATPLHAVHSLPVLNAEARGPAAPRSDELSWLRQGLLFSNHQAIESGGVGVAAAAAVAAAHVHSWLMHSPFDECGADRRHAETEPDVLAPPVVDAATHEEDQRASSPPLPEQPAPSLALKPQSRAAPGAGGASSSLQPPGTPSRAGFEVRCLLPPPPERTRSSRSLASAAADASASGATAPGGADAGAAAAAALASGAATASAPSPPSRSSSALDRGSIRVGSARAPGAASAAGALLQRDFFSPGPATSAGGGAPPNPLWATAPPTLARGGHDAQQCDSSSSSSSASSAGSGRGSAAAAPLMQQQPPAAAHYVSISAHSRSSSSGGSLAGTPPSSSSGLSSHFLSALASPPEGAATDESLAATAAETLSVVSSAGARSSDTSDGGDTLLGGGTSSVPETAVAAATAAALRLSSGAAEPPPSASTGSTAAGGAEAATQKSRRGGGAQKEQEGGLQQELIRAEPAGSSSVEGPRSPLISPRAPPRIRIGDRLIQPASPAPAAPAAAAAAHAPPALTPSWEAKTDVHPSGGGSLALLLRWHDRPSTVLVVAKRCGGPLVERALREALGALAVRHGCVVFVEPEVFRALAGSADETDRALADRVSTWGDVAALRAEAEQQRRLLAASDDDADPTSAGDCGRCPPADGPASPGASAGDAAHARPALPASVTASLDVAVTLGGDGTILWLSQLIGSGAVPPIVSFSLGSLCFMTPFAVSDLAPTLDLAIQGGFHITLRHRLICTVIRAPRPTPGGPLLPSSSSAPAAEPPPCEEHVVLNDVVIDRGLSAALTHLDCFCDDGFVTTVQGDGLIIATPSGSTAYSMSAGGSMVHPQVPAILFTPICPHSLSFRPLVFPDFVLLRIQVPAKARGTMSASFDGRDRTVLHPGDAVLVRMSRWPLPMVCRSDATTDWFTSIREVLHWNERTVQRPH